MKTNNSHNYTIKNEIDNSDETDKKKFIVKKGKEAENMILETFLFLEQTRNYELFKIGRAHV